MAYYQPEEIRKAKEMDLYTYLKNYEPDELVHFSRDTYMTRTHDSLKISNGMWYWFSRGIGGKTALEYLIQVREYTFIQAVETILGYSNDKPPVVYQQPKKVQNVRLILPKKSTTTDKVMSYLIGRGIDKDIISECIDNRLIYEDLPNHNVVFVGYDKNKVPRYAGVRATNNSRYMKDAYGSHKAFSFKLDSLEKSDTVHLFESAIDLLSYATLNKLENKEWYNDNLLSLAGVYQPAKKIDESKLTNVKLVAGDFYIFANQIEKNSIEGIFLNFSDPWPKRKHENRRLTSEKFLLNYSYILKIDGKIYQKTDNKDLFDYSLKMYEKFKWKIDEINLEYNELCEFDALTEYEEKFKGLGNKIYRIVVSNTKDTLVRTKENEIRNLL